MCVVASECSSRSCFSLAAWGLFYVCWCAIVSLDTSVSRVVDVVVVVDSCC